jgi:hypothetical protein
MPMRQWDDWRCYRCGTYQRQTAKRSTVLTPSGMPVAICQVCGVRAHVMNEHPLLDGGCEVCEFMLQPKAARVC